MILKLSNIKISVKLHTVANLVHGTIKIARLNPQNNRKIERIVENFEYDPLNLEKPKLLRIYRTLYSESTSEKKSETGNAKYFKNDQSSYEMKETWKSDFANQVYEKIT